MFFREQKGRKDWAEGTFTVWYRRSQASAGSCEASSACPVSCLGLKWVGLCPATAAVGFLHESTLCSQGWRWRSPQLRLVLPALHTWQRGLAWMGFWAPHLVSTTPPCNFPHNWVDSCVHYAGFESLCQSNNSHTQSGTSFTGSCKQRPRGPVGFLSPAAPAPFSGILFDFVTFSVQKASPTSWPPWR